MPAYLVHDDVGARPTLGVIPPPRRRRALPPTWAETTPRAAALTPSPPTSGRGVPSAQMTATFGTGLERGLRRSRASADSARIRLPPLSDLLVGAAAATVVTLLAFSGGGYLVAGHGLLLLAFAVVVLVVALVEDEVRLDRRAVALVAGLCGWATRRASARTARSLPSPRPGVTRRRCRRWGVAAVSYGRGVPGRSV